MTERPPAREAMRQREVVDFWMEAGPRRWFKKDPEFDAEIGRRFGPLAQTAANGAQDAWAETPAGALALVIVLDQFRRNLHRGTPDAFSADARALGVARAAVARGFDQALPADRRQWFYFPFEHSEDIADQERSVALFNALGDPETIKYAVLHRDIVARFGRFPHRNAILGRESRPQEEQFLAEGGFSG